MSVINNNPPSSDIEVPLEGLEHLVPEFLLKRKNELQELESYIQNKDFNKIGQLTHKWKGYSAPYGFGQLGRLANEMNILCEEKDLSKYQDILGKMKDYLSKKEKQIVA
jgi:HPt (histidine-containing phosphotransfer) domain-containing protein